MSISGSGAIGQPYGNNVIALSASYLVGDISFISLLLFI